MKKYKVFYQHAQNEEVIINAESPEEAAEKFTSSQRWGKKDNVYVSWGIAKSKLIKYVEKVEIEGVDPN